MKIAPASRIEGEVPLPGDKSISHRAAMIGSIAEGVTRIENYAASADCASTLSCLAQTGIDIERQGRVVVVRGKGKYGLSAPSTELDCGNSGTTMRLISGILAGQPFDSVLTGDESLRSRPMRRIIDPLVKMGAAIDSVDGRAPLTVHGHKPLNAVEYKTPVASAQIKSCVLLAGLYAEGSTSVIESVPTRDHTERMLSWFGAEVGAEDLVAGCRLTVPGDAQLLGRDFTVPGDLSAAAFFMVAAACLPGSRISMLNVGFNPTRAAICRVLRDLGVDIEISTISNLCNEPVADITVNGGLSRSRKTTAVIRGKTIANLIDEIPILAVLGTQLSRGIEIRDAAELRVKETDRIEAACRNLVRMGADVEEYEDGFKVSRSKLQGAQIDSYGDHRIAMAFAVAGLLADGETQIDGAECAAVSFPSFFETLESVVR